MSNSKDKTAIGETVGSGGVAADGGGDGGMVSRKADSGETNLVRALSNPLSFFEAAPFSGVGLWCYIADESRLVWDKQSHSIFGVDSNKGGVPLETLRSGVFPENFDKLSRQMEPPETGAGGRRAAGVEFRFRMPNGQVRHIYSVLLNSTIADVDHVSGVYVDMSSHKKVEEAFLHLNLKLEEQIASRTSELEKANRLKSQFLSNVSHEIRTPLTIILGYAEMIMERSQREPTTKEMAANILSETERVLKLINDILDLSKIESGKMAFEQNSFSLRKLLELLESQAGMQKRHPEVKFVLRYDDSIPAVVEGDQMKLHQVLLNLVSNALKFTESGEVVLAAECLSMSESYVNVEFSVVDTGIGIAPESREEIFKSFSQASRAIAHKYGGTGLGVTIANELVKLMGGEMQLDSELGRGSRFSFAITFQRGDETAGEEAAVVVEPVDGSARAARGGGALRILLAEDYPPSQTMIRGLLEDNGHEVTVVENGEEAVEICRGKQFDLILMDLRMPIMDGEEATKLIRNNPNPNRDVPIIALSASRDDSIEYLKLGFNEFVTKPFRLAKFFESVNRWFPERGGAGGAADANSAGHAPDAATPLDLKLAVEEFGGNERLFQDVLRGFVDNVARQLEILENLPEGECETARREAHKINGAAASVCAFSLSETAEALEMAAKRGKFQSIPTLVAELKRRYQELCRHLAERQSGGAPR